MSEVRFHIRRSPPCKEEQPLQPVAETSAKKKANSGCQTPGDDVEFISSDLDSDVEKEFRKNQCELDKKVTVKFVIRDVQTIARMYPHDRSIHELKHDLANRFELDPRLLVIRQLNKEVKDDLPLYQTQHDAFGIHEFDLELKTDEEKAKDPDYKPPKFDLNIYHSKYQMPDFLMVNVCKEDPCVCFIDPLGDCKSKKIVVEVENKAIVKPFLCGWVDKNTGIEYLNAFTQTGPSYEHWKLHPYVSRDTQTWEARDRIIDTPHEQTTQCYLDGKNVHFFSEPGDYEIIPTKYQTYAQKMRQENKIGKILLLQRNWRRVLAERFIKRAAAEFRRLTENRIAEERKVEEEAKRRIEIEQRQKLFPHSQQDFDMLLSDIEKWKISELKRIAQRYEGASRVTEVGILLDKEIQLRNAVERQRMVTIKAMQDFREEKLLTKLGEPLKWIGYKDKTIHMDLLRTQRVRFLHEIYKDLKKPIGKQERLELLDKVEEILKSEQDFPDYPELMDLFERERNLLAYAQFCDVEILRKRQNFLFMELIKFNKEQMKSKVEKRMCEVCKKVKPMDQFAIFTRQNVVDACKKCYYLKMPSADNSHYLAILRAIQREERKKRCNASFAFIMQVDDIRHLVEKIWHGHSILSKNEDIRCLRLPRWIKSNDWSPWNCVCLTESEARDHYQIAKLDEVYDKKLLLEIRNRRLLARNAFHTLAGVATDFEQSAQWYNVGLNTQRTALPLPEPNKTTYLDMNNMA